MAEHTPTTDEVCEAYGDGMCHSSGFSDRAGDTAAFYRWLAQHEKDLREQIARDLEAEADRTGASRSRFGNPEVDAFREAARIVREGSRHGWP